jgi:hypothetical protein
VESIRFQAEARIAEEIASSEQRVIQLREEARLWRSYKGILSASGPSLNEAVVIVLRSFFGLNLKSEETYVEDAIVYKSDGSSAFVVEIKGVNGGIKRDNVNQVDSHRERLQIGHEIPGLLIINDFCDTQDFDERKRKQIDKNHLSLAKAQNVKILRTTTLMELMLATEDRADRGSVFLRQCKAGEPVVSSNL